MHSGDPDGSARVQPLMRTRLEDGLLRFGRVAQTWAGPGWLYGTAIAIVAILWILAANARFGLKHPFLICYPAAILSAWIGGPIASLVTTFLLAVAAAYFWLPPDYAFAVSDEGDAIALFVFMGVGAVISGVAVALQRSRDRTNYLGTLDRDAHHSPSRAQDTVADARLRGVAEALRTAEVLIHVRKRTQQPEQGAGNRRARFNVRARSSIWIAPSERTACDTCGHPIKARDIAYEIVAAGYDLCIDRACYQRLITAVEHGNLRL